MICAGVLEEEEDVLVNVNILDNERAAKNVDNKKKVRHNPYQEQDEVDEFGEVATRTHTHTHTHTIPTPTHIHNLVQVKKPNMLKKYDEEIEGIKKQSFTLGN